MPKISQIFESKEKSFSFEVFPPKTEKGFEKLIHTLEDLSELQPDFISCTYGAGGGNRDKTLDIAEHIEKKFGVTAMAHLTCVLHTKNEIKHILGEIKNRGLENILALRGDPPLDQPDWEPEEDNFKYSCELVAFIREHFGFHFSIGVAGFPEGHLLSPDRDKDAEFLKTKIDAGANFIITQLFFDNKDYYEYVSRLRNLGITARVIPGILPITNYQGLLKFTAMCGASVPDSVKEIFEPIQDDPQKTLEMGKKLCVEQCRDLLSQGAPGLHFYTLNKVEPVKSIVNELKS